MRALLLALLLAALCVTVAYGQSKAKLNAKVYFTPTEWPKGPIGNYFRACDRPQAWEIDGLLRSESERLHLRSLDEAKCERATVALWEYAQQLAAKNK